jgi:hypothetical protein
METFLSMPLSSCLSDETLFVGSPITEGVRRTRMNVA